MRDKDRLTDRQAQRRRIIRTLEHVWFSSLIGWKNGWLPFEQAVDELEDTAAMLFAGGT